MKEEGLAEKQVEIPAGTPKAEAERLLIPDHRVFHRRLPSFGTSIKLHRENKPRFMSKSHQTSLTQLGQWISRALKGTSEVSEDIWRDLFATGGVATPFSWVITNNKAVRTQMKRMDAMPTKSNRKSARNQQTYDFSTMYTQLKLDAMKEKMKKYVEMVFEYAKDCRSKAGVEKVLIIHRKKSHTWNKVADNQHDTASTKIVTAERLIKWINYLLDNLYVKAAGMTLKQVIGIPMGASCSPFLANLTLFMYEYEFFRSFIRKHDPANNRNKRTLLWKLSCCTRYIDDLWNPLVDEQLFRCITKKIYPDWLQLGEPEERGASVNYLDMTIFHDAGIWQSKLYDKRKQLKLQGLKINKFPDPDSKITTRSKYGIITSQLHRFTVTCTRTSYFTAAATELYGEFIEKGYSKALIDKYCCKFLRRHSETVHVPVMTIAKKFQNKLKAATMPPPSFPPPPPPRTGWWTPKQDD